VGANQIGQFFFGMNRNAMRVRAAREFGGVSTMVDIRDLGSGERDHLVAGVVPEIDVEIMKITPSRPHDNNSFHHGEPSLPVSAVAQRRIP